MSPFLIMLLLLQFVYSWDDNIHRVGTGYQQDNTANDRACGSPLPSSPYLIETDFYFGWYSVEIANNVWNFSCLDNYFAEYVKINPNISISLLPTTGYLAPTWLYDDPINVPLVTLNDTGKSEHPTGPWPYYLDNNYKIYFKRFMNKIYSYIINSKYYPKNIFLTQACFGTTGDYSPWHGTPINVSYNISSDQWWDFNKEMATHICNLYYNSTPNTSPNLLVLFNYGIDMNKQNWEIQNCPGTYRKSGMVSHGYQLNNEMDNYLYEGNIIRNLVQNNITIRTRGELSGTGSGVWKQAPFWNYFTITQWYLTYGLDIPNFLPDFLNNETYNDIMIFFNLFAGKKHANESIGVFIGLRDGLDSNNTQRFPESIFGKATDSNQQRMILIAQNQSEYGAKQEDPSAATGGPMNQRSSKKFNDVGFGIWESNYRIFMSQIKPLQTSQGYWRIGPKSQMYGRFGRGFDAKSSKNKMCFVFDKDLWGGLPFKNNNNINLYFNVTYFDENDGTFSFIYDSQNDSNKIAFTQKKTNTNKWVIKNFNINDAYFGSRGDMNSDFCLDSNDDKDDIFSFIQVIRD